MRTVVISLALVVPAAFYVRYLLRHRRRLRVLQPSFNAYRLFAVMLSFPGLWILLAIGLAELSASPLRPHARPLTMPNSVIGDAKGWGLGDGRFRTPLGADDQRRVVIQAGAATSVQHILGRVTTIDGYWRAGTPRAAFNDQTLTVSVQGAQKPGWTSTIARLGRVATKEIQVVLEISLSSPPLPIAEPTIVDLDLQVEYPRKVGDDSFVSDRREFRDSLVVVPLPAEQYATAATWVEYHWSVWSAGRAPALLVLLALMVGALTVCGVFMTKWAPG